MKRIYISGPISGIPLERVKQSFNEAEIKLQKQGYEVVNPTRNGLSTDAPWTDHMRSDLKTMMDCDSIYLLKGFRESKGAMIEYDLARVLHFEIIYQAIK